MLKRKCLEEGERISSHDPLDSMSCFWWGHCWYFLLMLVTVLWWSWASGVELYKMVVWTLVMPVPGLGLTCMVLLEEICPYVSRYLERPEIN